MGVGVGFDMIRSNIPFRRFDVCIPDKIDDGTTAKSVRSSADDTRKLYQIGRGASRSARDIGQCRASVYCRKIVLR